VLIFNGCRKEKEVLTGDILGKIMVYNKDVSESSDKSGIQVNLFSEESLLKTTVTDTRGIYRLETVPYGKYRIDLQKENYLEEENYLGGADIYEFNHIGGYSPTLKDLRIYEIPDYVLQIDSVKALPSAGELLVYLKVDGDTIFPFFSYTLLGYYSNNPDVSEDNSSGHASGIIGNGQPLFSYKAPAEIFDLYINLPDTIYMRFYLLTMGQTTYYPINKEALGKPSNVISFSWQ
jgi:hypothetical protein